MHHDILVKLSWYDYTVHTILLCMSGSQQGRLSAHYSQHDNCARDATTSPTKNCAPDRAKSSQENWTWQCP